MDGERGARAPVSRRGFVRGAVGTSAAATAGAGVVGAQDGDETGGGGGAEDEVRQVEMTDDLVYVPEDITVAPGDTVRWVNVGQIEHTVTAYDEEIPEDGAYFASGGFESEQAARDAYPPEGAILADETYEHTFETAGTFGYFCIPHETVGMVGTVEVIEPGGAGDAGGGGGRPGLPDSAKTLGVAAVGTFATVLGLAYFFLKYGGGYEEVE